MAALRDIGHRLLECSADGWLHAPPATGPPFVESPTSAGRHHGARVLPARVPSGSSTAALIPFQPVASYSRMSCRPS
jgi:hypothetical protein